MSDSHPPSSSRRPSPTAEILRAARSLAFCDHRGAVEYSSTVPGARDAHLPRTIRVSGRLCLGCGACTTKASPAFVVPALVRELARLLGDDDGEDYLPKASDPSATASAP